MPVVVTFSFKCLLWSETEILISFIAARPPLHLTDKWDTQDSDPAYPGLLGLMNTGGAAWLTAGMLPIF